MAILKYVNLNNHPAGAKNPNLIDSEVHYILNPCKVTHFWGGCNLILTNAEDVIMQFHAIKNVYRKENYVQVRHFVLSFSPEYDEVDYYQASHVAYKICDLFASNFQMVYAVHEDRDYVHIHFILNPIDLYTGKTLHMDKKFFHDLHYEVRLILSCPSLWRGRKKVLLMDGIAF